MRCKNEIHNTTNTIWLVNKTNSAMEYYRYISNTSGTVYNNSSNKRYRKIGKEE